MSIQAVAWALEQDFFGRTPKGRAITAHAAKLVLISLANHADHADGHCYPSAKKIAKEASCKERSVYRLIYALERNGFIDIEVVRGKDGKQRNNHYWIRFDRQPAPWQYYSSDDEDDDTHDIDLPSDTVSSGETVDIPVENIAADTAPHDTESSGPNDIRVIRHVMPEPSDSKPSESQQVAHAPQPQRPKAAFDGNSPLGFDPKYRQAQVARLQAAEDARRAQPVFVFEGTEAWKAWQKAKTPRGTPVTIRKSDRRRGWWFPSLFPPKSTGPPVDASQSSLRDLDDFGTEMTG